jgi:hypothetical protein
VNNGAHQQPTANVVFAFNTGSVGNENNVSGSVSITNNKLNNSYQAGVDIQNYSGTISNLQITGNSLTSNTSNTLSLGTAINVVANRGAGNHANITAGSISTNTMLNFPSGAGIQVIGGNSNSGQAVTIASVGSPFIINGNTITGAGVGSAGIGTNGIAVTAGERDPHHELRLRAEGLGAVQRAAAAHQPEPGALLAARHDLRRRRPTSTSRCRTCAADADPRRATGHTLGERGGEQAHTLSIAEMPHHVHVLNGEHGCATGGTNVPAEQHRPRRVEPQNAYAAPRTSVAMAPERSATSAAARRT